MADRGRTNCLPPPREGKSQSAYWHYCRLLHRLNYLLIRSTQDSTDHITQLLHHHYHRSRMPPNAGLRHNHQHNFEKSECLCVCEKSHTSVFEVIPGSGYASRHQNARYNIYDRDNLQCVTTIKFKPVNSLVHKPGEVREP